MFTLVFVLAVKSKEEISHEFQTLYNNSHYQNATVFLNRTLYPGYYKYENIEFTLKMIVTGPYTNNIKGYSVDNNMITISKNENYSLLNNFAFIDPLQQKIYKMIKVIFSNSSINIYTATEITIFDIMTNFQYHKKNQQSQPFNAWIDDDTNNIKLYKINDNYSFFHFGVSTYGKVTIDTIITFNSKFDLNILSQISCEMSFDYKFDIPINCSYNITRRVESFPFNILKYNQLYDSDSDEKYSFLGFIIDLRTFINFELLPFNCMIRLPFGFEHINRKQIIGSKQVIITPYSTYDTNWDINIYDIDDNVNTTNNLRTVSFIPQLDLTMNFKFYSKIIFYLGNAFYDNERNPTLESGFEIAFRLGYGYNLNNCLSHYMLGYNEFKIYNFNWFSGVSYKDDLGNAYYVIEQNETITKSKSDKMGDYCIGDTHNFKFDEGSPTLFDIDSYLVYFEDFKVYWNKLPNFDTKSSSVDTDCQFFMEVINTRTKEVVMFESLPSQTFSISSSNPTKIYRQFVSNSLKKNSSINYGVNFFYKHWCNYITNGCNSSKDYHQITETPQAFYHGIAMLNVYNTFALTKAFQLNKMYRDNNNNKIALLPTNGVNYSIIGYDNNYKVHIDEKAEFSIKLSPKGIVSQVGICSLEKDYLIISISRINIVQEYFFNNIYVLCDGMEELIFSNRSMSKKTYSNINSKIGLYLPKSQNRKVSIGLDFHSKTEIHNPKYTTLNYTELIKMYDKRITFSSYTKNTVTFDFSFSENIPVNVKLSNNYYNKYETLSRVLNVNINDRVGKFSIVSLAKEQYIVLDLLLSDNLTVDKNDIILIFDNCIIPLSDEMKIITEKIYIFPGSKVYNNRIKIPIRFQTVYSTFRVSYAIAKYHETKDLTLNTEGETITFSSTKTAYAFVIPYFNEYFREDLVINSYTTYKVKKYFLEIEYSALLLVVIHENPNCPNQLIFALNRLTIPKYQLKLTYNTTFMKKFFPPNQIEYKVYIYSDNDYVKYIRYNNNYSMCKNYYKMLAVFTFNEVGVFDFYAVCEYERENMCEFNYSSRPNETEYHLVQFPSRDGINITGSGMFKGFIHVPYGKNITYYKEYYGPINFIRSYGNSTAVKLEVDDFPNENSTLLEDNNTDGYRRFCLKDENDNIIPLSLKFISVNLSILMNQVGVKDNFDVSQYSLTNDDCLAVNLSQIATNKIKFISEMACDIPINSTAIPIIMNGIKYFPKVEPTSTFSLSNYFSQSNTFSNTQYFSESNNFTNSKTFSNSNVFNKSNEFTYSNHFSNSMLFSNSNDFTYSIIFSGSDDFTYSSHFSKSNTFSVLKSKTQSFYFTDSDIFTQSPTQSKFGEIASLSMILTYSYVRSVTFSLSYFNQYSYSLCYLNDGNTYSYCQVKSQTIGYEPYIIYYLSPSYSQVSVTYIIVNKKRISQAQLIGIICGSCAVIFSIAGIAFLIINRRKINEGLVEDISETTSLIDSKNNKEAKINLNKNLQNNFDDAWI